MTTVTQRARVVFGVVIGAALAMAALSLGGNPDAQKAGQPKPHAGGHEPAVVGSAGDRGKLVAGQRASGLAPVPVEVPDVPKLPWKRVGGVKEYHLVAEHLKREFLPDRWFDVWGYNGSMPGPTIEAVEGDRVRIMVHNKLPEATSIHWHGLEVPIAQDGVPGLVQEPIPPGGSYTYEFTLRQNGTFFYHSHGAMQEGLGMVGLFIIHPKVAHDPPVDKDFALILQEWAILPMASVPNTMSMEFNVFTINGRGAPYITPLVVKQGERVRLRMVNFSPIDHHPMHLHGLTFWITGSEAGRIPPSAWVPRNTVLIGVAQAADVEFVADNPGDWMLHCHMFHHMMQFMSSMVGPTGGSMKKGMPAGGAMATGMGMISGGAALSREFGAQLGRGTGENTGTERAVANGIKPGKSPMPGMPGMPNMPGMPDMPGMPGMGKTGGHGGHGAAGKTVPGFPQDMFGMTMYSPAELQKLNSKWQTRGLRKDWFKGVEGLSTIVRVLPPALYDRIVAGEDVSPGASVPGSGPGKFGHDHMHKR